MTRRPERNVRWAIAVLGLLLVVSLLGNVLAALRLRRAYGDLWLAQIWPTGMAAVSLPSPGPERAILLLAGDSRMAEWPGSKLPVPGTVNAGVSGQTTAQLRLCLPAILDATHPRVVVIQAGINDLKVLGILPEFRGRVVDGCVSNLLAAVEACQGRGVRVIVTAIWPPGPVELARRLTWGSAIAPAVAEANARLKQRLKGMPGARFLDLYSSLEGESTSGLASLPLAYRDALHLEPGAYELLGSRLRRALDEFAEPRL